MVPSQASTPNKAIWTQKATALRAAAQHEPEGVARQTLLRLAEDCEAIAAEIEAQQPGKPKPPGNAPEEEPDDDDDRPRRRQEPPAPIMPPRPEPPPAPLQTQARRRQRR